VSSNPAAGARRRVAVGTKSFTRQPIAADYPSIRGADAHAVHMLSDFMRDA
jgi:hypothetical protein